MDPTFINLSITKPASGKESLGELCLLFGPEHLPNISTTYDTLPLSTLLISYNNLYYCIFSLLITNKVNKYTYKY